jgi:hypothetical protein
MDEAEDEYGIYFVCPQCGNESDTAVIDLGHEREEAGAP